MPNIIGLMIEPRIKPKRIHSLFNGNKNFGLVIVSNKRTEANDKKIIDRMKALTK